MSSILLIFLVIIIIIIIIIIFISFIQGIHSYVPETNHVPRGYAVAATLLFYCQYGVWCLFFFLLLLSLSLLFSGGSTMPFQQHVMNLVGEMNFQYC